jgi:predicted transcriptional regulator
MMDIETRVLMFIKGEECSIYPGEIACCLNMNRFFIQKALDSLQRKRLVKCRMKTKNPVGRDKIYSVPEER